MNLILKQIKKITKKIDGVPETVFQCVLEGADPSGIETVFGKLTLESGDLDELNNIVKQVIDSEVEIKFTHPQVTLECFAEQ
jgi:hypothetical protein